MASGESVRRLLLSTVSVLVSCALSGPSASIAAESLGLWQVYEFALKTAKYVDLTHTITPKNPSVGGFC